MIDEHPLMLTNKVILTNRFILLNGWHVIVLATTISTSVLADNTATYRWYWNSCCLSRNFLDTTAIVREHRSHFALIMLNWWCSHVI